MYNFFMNLKKYTNQTVLLFGKTRSFSFEELSLLLKKHNITLYQGYTQNASLVIEGALISTLLKEKIDELYKQGGYEFVDIDTFEKEVAKKIEPKKLLMSLKLSNNQEKIISFLQNEYISNDLFLSLLKLFRYGDEDFFENDTNRDITASIIKRFYSEYYKNHNIQYSVMGLINAISQSKDCNFLETIFFLKPTKKNKKLLKVFALHPLSSNKILEIIF